MGQVNARDASSLLVTMPDGQQRHYILNLDSILIGRESACTIPLKIADVSRQHAKIELGDQVATLQDLGSSNGTVLNGKRLAGQPVALRDRDLIQIADIRIRYLGSGSEGDQTSRTLKRDDQLITRMGTALSEGTFTTLVAENPELVDSPEAQDALFHIVLTRHEVPRLIVRENQVTREIPLGAERTEVGRDATCQVRLTDQLVSLRHAAVERANDEFVVRDLGSTNGVVVNGLRVSEATLAHGDLLRMGETTLRFVDARIEEFSSPKSTDRRRPVVIIPGFSGSELRRGEVKIWPNMKRLLTSSDDRIKEDWRSAEVGLMVREPTTIPGIGGSDSFGTLLRFLEKRLGYRSGEDLLEFPYDWRQDNQQTARQLAESIRQWRASRGNPTEKLVLVAHSMGGLVSRLYLNQFGGAEAVERCVFLGTPHRGSAACLRMAVSGTGVLPFGLALKRLQQVLLEFPAFHQLMPTYRCASFEDGKPFFPFESEPDWLPAEYREHFQTAAGVRKLLETATIERSVPTTCIFGYRRKTPHHLVLRREPGGNLTLVDLGFSSRGDGTVAEESAILDHAEIHPVVQQHSALHSDRDVMRQLRFELVERPWN